MKKKILIVLIGIIGFSLFAENHFLFDFQIMNQVSESSEVNSQFPISPEIGFSYIFNKKITVGLFCAPFAVNLNPYSLIGETQGYPQSVGLQWVNGDTSQAALGVRLGYDLYSSLVTLGLKGYGQNITLTIDAGIIPLGLIVEDTDELKAVYGIAVGLGYSFSF